MINFLDKGQKIVTKKFFEFKLKKLRSLWLFNNQISDINPIKNLKNLKYLDLRNNKIEEIISNWRSDLETFENNIVRKFIFHQEKKDGKCLNFFHEYSKKC